MGDPAEHHPGGEGGIFQAVLWNPNYLLRCPVSVPFPTFEKLRFRDHCPKSFSSYCYSGYGRICKFML
jgi:hypothetical protein